MGEDETEAGDEATGVGIRVAEVEDDGATAARRRGQCRQQGEHEDARNGDAHRSELR